MPPHRMMPGAYSFSVIHTWVRAYECVYEHDPVRLRIRHLYQVEFCSFIVRYLTAGASVSCGHISSFILRNIYTIPHFSVQDAFSTKEVLIFSYFCTKSICYGPH